MRIDLHMHSSASDGADSPARLMEKCREAGMDAVALTDHDTLSGVREALEAGSSLGLRVIAGVELSAGGQEELHILGYGMRDAAGMEKVLSGMRAARRDRLRRMAEKLREAGVFIDADAVAREAGEAVGRPHVARALVAGGYCSSVKEAFSRYLTPGKPGYVPREKLEPAEAVRMIRAFGGIAGLAHPGISLRDNFFLPERVEYLKEVGLSCLEAHHPRHTPAQCARLDMLAREKGLLVTGGSDYHGAAEGAIGQGLAGWTAKDADFTAFMRALGL